MADELEQPKPNGKDTRFKPGAEWRGNKGGRPKSKHITRAYALYLLNHAKYERETPAYLKKQVEATMKAWREGDMKAEQAVVNRVEGKVPSVNQVVTGSIDEWTRAELEAYAAGGEPPKRFIHLLRTGTDCNSE